MNNFKFRHFITDCIYLFPYYVVVCSLTNTLCELFAGLNCQNYWHISPLMRWGFSLSWLLLFLKLSIPFFVKFLQNRIIWMVYTEAVAPSMEIQIVRSIIRINIFYQEDINTYFPVHFQLLVILIELTVKVGD